VTLFGIVEQIAKCLIIFFFDGVGVAHELSNVLLLLFFKKLINLFILKGLISDTMNFLKIKHNCISKISGFYLYFFVGKLLICHIEGEVHLVCHELGSDRQEFAHCLEAMHSPGKIKLVKILHLLMIKTIMLRQFHQPMFSKHFGEITFAGSLLRQSILSLLLLGL